MIETEPLHMLGILLNHTGVCAQIGLEIRDGENRIDITSTTFLIHIYKHQIISMKTLIPVNSLGHHL